MNSHYHIGIKITFINPAFVKASAISLNVMA